MSTKKKTMQAPTEPKVIHDEKSVEKLLEDFARTTNEVVTLSELKKKLLSGKQLIMKYGVDVTAPTLHIGHAVNLWMYRRLQEMGHKVIFLVGDFTTQIGDPTGKSKARPIIPAEEIRKNVEEFIKQACMVLHDDPKVMEIRRNSEWFGKMSAKDLISLMSLVTNEKLLGRDMFKKRMEEGREIYEHELIYPILQGYDSFVLEADLTIIGSDQLFNEMMGRFYQEKFGQETQVIVTTKITPGIDGREKQSKSLGNYIGLMHSAKDKFGRVMSIPDSLIVEYFKVYTDVPMKEIAAIEKNIKTDAMKSKLALAKEIVKRYHGEKEAESALKEFKKVFSNKEIPDDIPEIVLTEKGIPLIDLLLKSGVESKSQARRLISQGAVEVDGVKKSDFSSKIEIKKPLVLKIGKTRFFRVISKA